MNNSHLPAFGVLAVSLSLFLLSLLRSNSHQVIAGYSVYKYPKSTVYFFLVAALIFLTVSFWAPLLAKRDTPVPIDIPLIGAVPSLLLFFWAKRYRVVLGGEGFRFGAFRIREVSYSDLVRATYWGNPLKGKISLYMSSGDRITFSSSINDFKSLVDDICIRLPKTVVIERLGEW
jgi:hypothetical protein